MTDEEEAGKNNGYGNSYWCMVKAYPVPGTARNTWITRSSQQHYEVRSMVSYTLHKDTVEEWPNNLSKIPELANGGWTLCLATAGYCSRLHNQENRNQGRRSQGGYP